MYSEKIPVHLQWCFFTKFSVNLRHFTQNGICKNKVYFKQVNSKLIVDITIHMRSIATPKMIMSCGLYTNAIHYMHPHTVKNRCVQCMYMNSEYT